MRRCRRGVALIAGVGLFGLACADKHVTRYAREKLENPVVERATDEQIELTAPVMPIPPPSVSLVSSLAGGRPEDPDLLRAANVRFTVQPTEAELPVTSEKRVPLHTRSVLIVPETTFEAAVRRTREKRERFEPDFYPIVAQGFAAALKRRGWDPSNEKVLAEALGDPRIVAKLAHPEAKKAPYAIGATWLSARTGAESVLFLHDLEVRFSDVVLTRITNPGCPQLRVVPLVVSIEADLIRGTDGEQLWHGKQSIRATDVLTHAETVTYTAACRAYVSREPGYLCFETDGAACARDQKPKSGAIVASALDAAVRTLGADLDFSAYTVDADAAHLATRAPLAKPVIAVFDVQGDRKHLEAKATLELTDYLSARLAEAGFRVVPHAQLRTLLENAKADGYRDCFDEACQVELGKALAAEGSLATRLIRLDNVCALTSTLFDLRTETARQAASAVTDCSAKGILAGLDRIAADLSGLKR